MRAGRALAAGALALAAARWLPRRTSFKGAVVLITGGSRGLGLLLAREFGRRGARLAICARNRIELERAREDLAGRGYEVFTEVVDVSLRDSANACIDQVVQHYGRLDVVVNCAGNIQIGPMQAMDSKDFHGAVGTIFWGTYYISQAALPHLRHSPRPRLVNIASIGGAVPVPHLLPYVAAKFAVVGYSSGLAVEARTEGVRVVTVLPGLMRTGSSGNALVKGHRREETAWFTLAASLPLLSLNAHRAARRIVAATHLGTPYVTLGLPAKLMRLASALFPGLTIRTLAAAVPFLPGPLTTADGPPTRAADHRSGIASSRWVALGDRAAAENNEEQVPAREQLH